MRRRESLQLVLVTWSFYAPVIQHKQTPRKKTWDSGWLLDARAHSKSTNICAHCVHCHPFIYAILFYTTKKKQPGTLSCRTIMWTSSFTPHNANAIFRLCVLGPLAFASASGKFKMWMRRRVHGHTVNIAYRDFPFFSTPLHRFTQQSFGFLVSARHNDIASRSRFRKCSHLCIVNLWTQVGGSVRCIVLSHFE